MSDMDTLARRGEPRELVVAKQAVRLSALLVELYGRNLFYTRKLDVAGIRPATLHLPEDFPRLPLTTKAELVADQEAHPPWGTDLTYPLETYTAYHQTSSTTDHPLRWMDTPQSWQWIVDHWKLVYSAAHVDNSDRILFPFAFGPCAAFWGAFDAARQIGALCIPTGGMTSMARLLLIESASATVVCCTPTYALRLAQVAAAEKIQLNQCSVRVVLIAGEPGGSIPETRNRIEQAWGARVIEHYGLTEVGPVGFECWDLPRVMLVDENEYICEVLDPKGEDPVHEGKIGELVITNLGRTGSPVIRYRTGDLVRMRPDSSPFGHAFAQLQDGILSRSDHMVVVRGVNVYPGAVEAVVRRFPEITEYRATVSAPKPMRELHLEIELHAEVSPAEVVRNLQEALHQSLQLSVPVEVIPVGTLPQCEMKARRFIVENMA